MKRILVLSLFLSVQAFANYEVIPGQYIVKLKNQSLANLKNNTFSVEENFEALGSQFAVINSGQSFKSLKASLPEIEYIEPNYKWKAIGTKEEGDLTDDPKSGLLWGLDNTGTNEPLRSGGTRQGIAGVDIKAIEAWELTKGSDEVVIAVIDTGIDYNHDDLKANMWRNEAELNGEAGVDDDGNGFVDDIYGYDFANDDADPVDDHGHGTHCAGTIGAVHNNKIGVAGVMVNVKLMALKFLTGSGSGTTVGAIKSIDYATNMGVDLMSNSWGGGGESQALKEAIERANEKGIIFTAAAGNSSSNNDVSAHYPSNYQVDNVISVAATNAKDELASFSCYGKTTVHVAAPGRNILSTVLNNGYDVYSGTSMATPHVSGIVGLYIAHNGKTEPKLVRQHLMDASHYSRAYSRVSVSQGRVDAHKFLLREKADRPAKPDPRAWEPDATQVFESLHPYADKSEVTKDFTIAGAKFIRAVFEKIDTEKKYDTLTLKDSEGNTLEVLSGLYENHATEYAEGDTLSITFKSDYSVSKFGYKLKEIQYILE